MSIEQEVERALELLNSGLWLQLEGSVGRWVNGFLEGGYIVKDEERTKKDGPVVFTDGYGRLQKQYYGKIDWDVVDANIEEQY